MEKPLWAGAVDVVCAIAKTIGVDDLRDAFATLLSGAARGRIVVNVTWGRL